MTDYRQEIDTVARGSLPILIGTDDPIAESLMRQGLPFTIVDARQLREGTDLGTGQSSIAAIFDRPPHSNAAKVYLNWLLSREEQTLLARAQGTLSVRLDVPTDHALPWRTPQPGALKTYTRGAISARDQLVPLIQELFGR